MHRQIGRQTDLVRAADASRTILLLTIGALLAVLVALVLKGVRMSDDLLLLVIQANSVVIEKQLSEAVGYRNARDTMVTSSGDQLVLVHQPAQAIASEHPSGRCRWPGGLSAG
jgi:hypothetical protein